MIKDVMQQPKLKGYKHPKHLVCNKCPITKRCVRQASLPVICFCDFTGNEMFYHCKLMYETKEKLFIKIPEYNNEDKRIPGVIPIRELYEEYAK